MSFLSPLYPHRIHMFLIPFYIFFWIIFKTIVLIAREKTLCCFIPLYWIVYWKTFLFNNIFRLIPLSSLIFSIFSLFSIIFRTIQNSILCSINHTDNLQLLYALSQLFIALYHLLQQADTQCYLHIIENVFQQIWPTILCILSIFILYLLVHPIISNNYDHCLELSFGDHSQLLYYSILNSLLDQYENSFLSLKVFLLHFFYQ